VRLSLDFSGGKPFSRQIFQAFTVNGFRFTVHRFPTVNREPVTVNPGF